MKCTIDSTRLTKALEQAAKFAPNKPSMPILSNLKLVATGSDRLEIAGFNLAHGIEVKCLEVDVIEEGSVCIPVTAIAIIKGMRGQLILEAGENNLITISSLTGEIEIQGQSTEAYPILDSVDSLPFDIDAKLLTQAVKYCAQACSIDGSKQVLTGINVSATEGILRAMATDGHRLVVCNIPTSETVKIESVTIPAKSLLLIPSDGSQFIQGKFSKSQVSIDSGSRSIMRTLDGSYPDAMMLVPKTFTRTVEIDRLKLIGALNVMSAISDQNNLVKFAIDKCVGISSSSDGKSGKDRVDCQLVGDSIDIAFNLKYLIDGLKMFETELIKISMNESLQPVVITGVDSVLDLIYLCMPVNPRS